MEHTVIADLPQHTLKCRWCPWTTTAWKGPGRAGQDHLLDHVRKKHGDKWRLIERWARRMTGEW